MAAHDNRGAYGDSGTTRGDREDRGVKKTPSLAPTLGALGWFTHALARVRWANAKSLSELDAELLELLKRPPEQDERIQRLQARADAAAERLVGRRAAGELGWWPPEVDLVCSGGGFLVVYFLGLYLLLDALERCGQLRIRRLAGASSGGKAALLLRLAPGPQHVVAHYLAQADLHARHGVGPSTIDYHQRWIANWLVDTWVGGDDDEARWRGVLADKLDGSAFVAVTVPFASPHGRLVGRYPTLDDVRQAFVATGTFLTKFDGQWASDGGLALPCNTRVAFPPIVGATATDGDRAQLVVDLMHAQRFKLSLAWRLDPQFALDALEGGMDDLATMLAAASPAAANAVTKCNRLYTGIMRDA
jgi:hypothetical protein